MTQLSNDVLDLARDLIAIDSRSSVSNLAVAERIEAELDGFDIEQIDYLDGSGVKKRVLVAHRGPMGGYAMCGHMDTVPDTGWTGDPWAPILRNNQLCGLGSTDMKGPLASCIVALRNLHGKVPATLILTTDEETTKDGAREVVAKSELLKTIALDGILVAESTSLIPIRGHRSYVEFTVVANGIQAHSASGKGINANWQLIPFLARMKEIHERLRADPSLHDPGYSPPFSDFNLTLDNHGTALNVTVPLATAKIKLRRSRNVDTTAIEKAVHTAAEAAGLAVLEKRDGPPMELPSDHPLVRICETKSGESAQTASWGTDASILQALAPCVVLGPGSIDTAHTPSESVPVNELEKAVHLFQDIMSSATVRQSGAT